MKKNTSYREMLRDRCPKVVSYALKWCKAKEKWLDYVYDNQIWFLGSKNERLKQTKLILGIKEDGKREFDFDKTICWKDLTVEEHAYWDYVSHWVRFFMKHYAYIENAYRTSEEAGKSIKEIKLYIITKWLKDLCPTSEDSDEVKKEKNQYINSLTDYLIDCFNE